MEQSRNDPQLKRYPGTLLYETKKPKVILRIFDAPPKIRNREFLSTSYSQRRCHLNQFAVYMFTLYSLQVILNIILPKKSRSSKWDFSFIQILLLKCLYAFLISPTRNVLCFPDLIILPFVNLSVKQ